MRMGSLSSGATHHFQLNTNWLAEISDTLHHPQPVAASASGFSEERPLLCKDLRGIAREEAICRSTAETARSDQRCFGHYGPIATRLGNRRTHFEYLHVEISLWSLPP